MNDPAHEQKEVLRYSDGDPRIEVRFRDLIDRRAAYPGMHLDEVLNAVGAKRFPDDWGRTAAWAQHPFLYLERFDSFLKVDAYKDEENGWLFGHLEADLRASVDEKDLKQADQLYKAAAAAVCAAIELGEIKAFYTQNGKIRTIPSCTWSDQHTALFYTGFVYKKVGANGTGAIRSRRPALIDRSSFTSWLKGPKKHPKNLPARMASDLIEVLVNHAFRTGTKHKHDNLFRLLREALHEQGLLFSERQFDQVIWSDKRFAPIRQPIAPPTAEASRLLLQEEQNIRSLIQRACGPCGHSPRPSGIVSSELKLAANLSTSPS